MLKCTYLQGFLWPFNKCYIVWKSNRFIAGITRKIPGGIIFFLPSRVFPPSRFEGGQNLDWQRGENEVFQFFSTYWVIWRLAIAKSQWFPHLLISQCPATSVPKPSNWSCYNLGEHLCSNIVFEYLKCSLRAKYKHECGNYASKLLS